MSIGGPPEGGNPQWEAPQPPQWGEGEQAAAAPVAPPAPPGAQTTPGKATASLVLGIVGLLVCPIVCSVLAIVFGIQAKSEIDGSGGRLGGRGMAQAGVILGILGLVAFVVLFAVGFYGGITSA